MSTFVDFLRVQNPLEFSIARNRKRPSHAGAEPFFSIFHRKNRNVKVFAICFMICTTHGKYVYSVDPVRQMDYKALEHGK